VRCKKKETNFISYLYVHIDDSFDAWLRSFKLYFTKHCRYIYICINIIATLIMHKNKNINSNNNKNNNNNASASTSDQFSKNTLNNRNLISSCDNNPDKGHCNSNRFGFTKISANVRKNFNKLMHKQHSPNAETFDSATTNSYGHSISLTHEETNAANANNNLATRCRNLSLQDTDIDTNGMRFCCFEVSLGLAFSLNRILFHLEDYIKLQTQLIDNLRNLTESEESEIVVLNNEIGDLRKQIEMRNQPIVAQIDIDKLKEDIRVLTYQKAELELAIRKSAYTLEISIFLINRISIFAGISKSLFGLVSDVRYPTKKSSSSVWHVIRIVTVSCEFFAAYILVKIEAFELEIINFRWRLDLFLLSCEKSDNLTEVQNL
jgi:hypothetical protein